MKKNFTRLQFRHNSSMRVTPAFRKNLTNNIKTSQSGLNLFYNMSPLLSKRAFSAVTVSVPNMGDSITEGTLVEWTKSFVY